MGVRSESLRKGWTTASAHSPLQLEGGDKLHILRRHMERAAEEDGWRRGAPGRGRDRCSYETGSGGAQPDLRESPETHVKWKHDSAICGFGYGSLAKTHVETCLPRSWRWEWGL